MSSLSVRRIWIFLTVFLLGVFFIRIEFNAAQLESIKSIHANPLIRHRHMFYEVSSDKSDADRLLDLCKHMFHREVTLECMQLLTETYSSDPIWAIERFMYHTEGSHGLEMVFSKFNNRSLFVGYGHTAFEEEVPRWRDILSGDTEQMMRMVISAFEDQACKELISLTSGIRVWLIEHCNASEFYKYATLLDVCVTNMARFTDLSSKSTNRSLQATNRFEESLELVKQRALEMPERYIGEYETQVRLAMAAAWVARECAGKRLTPLVGSQAIDEQVFNSDPMLGSETIVQLLRYSHDTALRVAAKAGDRWALLSYFPEFEGSDYLHDLYEIYPVLVHRFLASDLGSEALTEEAQRYHSIRAYSMLKPNHPDLDNDWEFLVPTVEEEEFWGKNKPVQLPIGEEFFLTPNNPTEAYQGIR